MTNFITLMFCVFYEASKRFPIRCTSRLHFKPESTCESRMFPPQTCRNRLTLAVIKLREKSDKSLLPECQKSYQIAPVESKKVAFIETPAFSDLDAVKIAVSENVDLCFHCEFVKRENHINKFSGVVASH